MSSKYENSGLSHAPSSVLGDLFGAAVTLMRETVESGAAATLKQPQRTNGNDTYDMGVKYSLGPAFDRSRLGAPAPANHDHDAPLPYWKRVAAPAHRAA